jgi:hypothetical protein
MRRKGRGKLNFLLPSFSGPCFGLCQQDQPPKTMEATIPTYQSTKHHNPEKHRHIHRHGNLRSHKEVTFRMFLMSEIVPEWAASHFDTVSVGKYYPVLMR